jgi:hypothetical protein
MTTTVPFLTFGHFMPPVRHGVSTRYGGVSEPPYDTLNLSGKVGDDPAAAAENRGRFARAVCSLPQERLVVLTQVHGARVMRATAADCGRGIVPGAAPLEEADALMTNEPGVPLQVLAADCVPLLLWDPVRSAVAAVHAGWRGAVAGVVPATVAAMRDAYGSAAGGLRAGVGPAIGPCCYEVDAPVLDGLAAAYPAIAPYVTQPSRPGHAMLDLQETVRRQLLALGVAAEHIEVMRLCTACRPDLLYSDRQAGRRTGRFAALIMLGE